MIKFGDVIQSICGGWTSIKRKADLLSFIEHLTLTIDFFPDHTTNLLRSVPRIPGKAIGHTLMSLQLSSTSPGFEIRT